MSAFNKAFTKSRNRFGVMHSMMLSIVLFVCIIFCFLFTIGKINSQSHSQQKEYLEDAIERGMLQCYITEGRYPESMDYLEENYGITYDKDEYRVDYTVYGTNLRPTVEVVELEDKD